MPAHEDLLFGNLSVTHKFARPEQVTECLQVQADEEAEGLKRSMGEIMVAKGYLKPDQVAEILRLQGERGQQRMLGPYELLGKLGQGGMGTVFKARLNGTQIDVALKVLPDHLVRNADLLQRFKREATIGRELLHPHVVRTLDFGADRGVHYITLELVEGGDLDARLKKQGRLPEREALGIVRDVAKGLQHAHERGLVHRDIKPANIMFDRSGTVKVSDFGLVKDTDPNASSVTQTGAMMGTPFYLAPEQAENAKDLDIRADIYALGATLYHLVTGRPPFQGETPYQVVIKHIREPLTPPDQVNPALSPGCSRLIKRMMSKDRAMRHSSPQEVADEIERLLRALATGDARQLPPGRIAGAQTVAAQPAPGVRAPREAAPDRRNQALPMVWVYSGAAAVVLLLLLLGWALFGRGGQTPAPAKMPEPERKTAAVPPPPPPMPVPAPRVAVPPIPAPVPVPAVVATPATPATPAAAADWTSLLPGINPGRDAISGRWSNERDGLFHNQPGQWMSNVIEVGLPPAEEFDFRIEFTVNNDNRQGWGRGEINMIFPAGGKHLRFAMWSLDFYHTGFVWDRQHFIVGNAARSNNPTLKRQPALLEQRRIYTGLVEVRREAVRGYVDGQLISEWRPADWNANDMESFALRDRRKLGVGCYQSIVMFSKVDVRPHRP